MRSAWIVSGSGRGIGTERGIRGRFARSRSFVALPIYLVLSLVIVGFEGSRHYVEAAAVTVVTVVVLVYGMALPGLGQSRVVEQWAAGRGIDRARAMDATYAWARGAVARSTRLDRR